jgi:hypothetical protein
MRKVAVNFLGSISLALALLACASCHAPAPARSSAPADALPFEPLLKGYQSGLRTPGAQLITDDAHWTAFWKQHSHWRIPAPAAPQIDFSTRSVLAISLGDKPSAGWSLELRWLVLRNGRLVVHVAQHPPPKDHLVPQVVTQPYAIVTLARTEAQIEFELE